MAVFVSGSQVFFQQLKSPVRQGPLAETATVRPLFGQRDDRFAGVEAWTPPAHLVIPAQLLDWMARLMDPTYRDVSLLGNGQVSVNAVRRVVKAWDYAQRNQKGRADERYTAVDLLGNFIPLTGEYRVPMDALRDAAKGVALPLGKVLMLRLSEWPNGRGFGPQALEAAFLDELGKNWNSALLKKLNLRLPTQRTLPRILGFLEDPLKLPDRVVILLTMAEQLLNLGHPPVKGTANTPMVHWEWMLGQLERRLGIDYSPTATMPRFQNLERLRGETFWRAFNREFSHLVADLPTAEREAVKGMVHKAATVTDLHLFPPLLGETVPQARLLKAIWRTANVVEQAREDLSHIATRGKSDAQPLSESIRAIEDAWITMQDELVRALHRRKQGG